MIKHLILFYQTISWYIWFILRLNYIFRLKLHITVSYSDYVCLKQRQQLQKTTELSDDAIIVEGLKFMH